MDQTTAYLLKQPHFKPGISDQPQKNLGFVVVIPCHDEPDVLSTVESLKSCVLPEAAVEVIIVINASENADKQLLERQFNTTEELRKWTNPSEQFRLHILEYNNLPEKFSGAGLARKLGMDEAVYRFGLVNNPKGIICSMDADTICDPEYFLEIRKKMKTEPGLGGGTIYFEHPLEGNDFNHEVYKAVTLYELHMRYYKQALRSSGFPYAFYTVGSAFFVTAETYVRAGGMNRRKAGEDFYFLQKVFPMVPFSEITSTKVIPSPRPSQRVPFGTGPWVQDYVNNRKEKLSTYYHQAFEDLKVLFDLVHSQPQKILSLYQQLPESLKAFTGLEFLKDRIIEIESNTSSAEAFKKRFFSWFNGFMVVKYLNFAHKNYYKKQDILVQARKFLEQIKGFKDVPDEPEEVLGIYRKLDQE